MDRLLLSVRLRGGDRRRHGAARAARVRDDHIDAGLPGELGLVGDGDALLLRPGASRAVHADAVWTRTLQSITVEADRSRPAPGTKPSP